MIIHVRTAHHRCQAQIVAQDTEQKHGKQFRFFSFFFYSSFFSRFFITFSFIFFLRFFSFFICSFFFFVFFHRLEHG